MRIFLYLLILSAFALGSCNKATNNTSNNSTTTPQSSGSGSLTINGDIFTNQVFSLSVKKTIDTFISKTNITSVSVGASADSFTVNVIVAFSGQTTIKNAQLLAAGIPDIIISISPVSNPTAYREYSSTSGTLSVTAYGAVGTYITGTFSGTFTPTAGTSSGITVTNGSFSVKRTE